jgi:hypothetical protein
MTDPDPGVPKIPRILWLRIHKTGSGSIEDTSTHVKADKSIAKKKMGSIISDTTTKIGSI